MSEGRAYVLLPAVILFWAGNFSLGKLALGELGPVTLTAGRALLAAPLLLAVARLTAPLGQPLARRDYLAFAVLGLTGLVGNTTLWYWGLQQTTALNAGILGAASPSYFGLATGFGLATTAAGLALSSLWSPFTSSTNCPTSLNFRYTEAKRT